MNLVIQTINQELCPPDIVKKLRMNGFCSRLGNSVVWSTKFGTDWCDFAIVRVFDVIIGFVEEQLMTLTVVSVNCQPK